MKNAGLLVVLLIVGVTSYGQSYQKRYKSKLEPNSKLILAEANYTIEEDKTNGDIIYKMYYPPTQQITKLVTYKDLKSKIKEGPYQENWDDGTVVNKGRYENNLKQGFWILNTYTQGEFKNDLKNGIWKDVGADSIVGKMETYLLGQLHGKQIIYDSLGNIEIEYLYEHGELVSKTNDSIITTKVIEEMPRFPGCENQGLSEEELTKCATKKLLTYVYSNLKYPKKAREENIEGLAIVEFVVDVDGGIIDLKALNGLSADIKKEVFKLVKKMPKWVPGMKDGQAVKVLFTLPIRYKLE